MGGKATGKYAGNGFGWRRGRTMKQLWVENPGGCWLWVGSIMPNGYGQKKHLQRNGPAHRWMYEQRIGPIPAGMQIDHVCNVRHCVNPEHLEVVTPEENRQRALELRDDCRHLWRKNT